MTPYETLLAGIRSLELNPQDHLKLIELLYTYNKAEHELRQQSYDRILAELLKKGGKP